MKYITILVVCLLTFASCTKDFQEINTNPNVPEQADPQFLLTNVIYNAANNNAVDAWNAGNYLGQLTARKDFNETDRWDIRSNQELWDKNYLLLQDVETLRTDGMENNPAYEGVALVMRAFLASTLTDLWGDVPYFDALQGKNGNFTPAYDRQEAIYTAENGILNTLEKAVEILAANREGVTIKGDVLYSGDLDKWIKFANSLQVRYLLRISGKTDVSADLQALVDAGNIFQSNADNALVPYLASAPNQWFVHNIRSGDFGDVRMSNTIAAILNDNNDPRLPIFFRPTETSIANGETAYEGMPNGIGPATRGDYDFSDVSQPGEIFREQADGVDAVFMTYSELQFALAEAAQKGFITSDAQAFYEAGVTSSLAYYGVNDAAAYLAEANVNYTESTALEQIITQKWLASMLVGYEGWFNYRRTGFPALSIAVENLNNDELPVRYIYPATEQALNLENYNEAVARMGADNYNAKGWWEE